MRKLVPRIESVSVWDFHPDPSATSIEDAEYVIQRHRMNRQQLRSLISPFFYSRSNRGSVLLKVLTTKKSTMKNTIRDEETEASLCRKQI